MALDKRDLSAYQHIRQVFVFPKVKYYFNEPRRATGTSEETETFSPRGPKTAKRSTMWLLAIAKCRQPASQPAKWLCVMVFVPWRRRHMVDLPKSESSLSRDDAYLQPIGNCWPQGPSAFPGHRIAPAIVYRLFPHALSHGKPHARKKSIETDSIFELSWRFGAFELASRRLTQ